LPIAKRVRKKKKTVNNESIVSQTCSDEIFLSQTKEVTERQEKKTPWKFIFLLGELNDVRFQFQFLYFLIFLLVLILNVTLIFLFNCLAMCARSDDPEAELIQR